MATYTYNTTNNFYGCSRGCTPPIIIINNNCVFNGGGSGGSQVIPPPQRPSLIRRIFTRRFLPHQRQQVERLPEPELVSRAALPEPKHNELLDIWRAL